MRCREHCRHAGCRFVQQHFIYVLIDIRTGYPFYLGESLYPWRRRQEHIRGALNPVWPDYAKQVYIRSLLEDGLYPYMVIVDSLSSDCKSEVAQIENAYADFFRANGLVVESGHTYDFWDEAESRHKTVYARLEPQYLEKDLEVFYLLREMYLYG